MRKLSVLLAVTACTLFLGFGAAAHAQSVTTLPGVPSGQGGPDNNVNATQQGGDATGGRDNPVADAGPAVETADESGSVVPWLAGAAALLVIVAVGALIMRRAQTTDAGTGADRSPSYSA